MAIYREITCSSALHRINSRRLPFSWDLNIYRGCEHGCKYCYALYSHDYLGLGEYFEDIYVKINVVNRLEEQLSNPNWRREVINIGGVTDSYQSAESEYKLMPDILRLLIKYKTPCTISTKSDLILRDYDLLTELSAVAHVNVAVTVTCMNEDIRKLIEPNGAPSLKRFEVLRVFATTKISTGLHLMPIIPFVTDDRDNIYALHSLAKDSGADYVINDMLNLRSKTKQVFFRFITQKLPTLSELLTRVKSQYLEHRCLQSANLYEKLWTLYSTEALRTEYKRQLLKTISKSMREHALSFNYNKTLREERVEPECAQLSFF